MVAGALAAVEAIAPSTQIKINFENKLGNKAVTENGAFKMLPLPVDIKIQNLLKDSMIEENIAAVDDDDLTWLPWM
jgi:hypothetical protein